MKANRQGGVGHPGNETSAWNILRLISFMNAYIIYIYINSTSYKQCYDLLCTLFRSCESVNRLYDRGIEIYNISKN